MVSRVVQVMHDARETYYLEKENGSIFNDEVASTTSRANTPTFTFTSRASTRPLQEASYSSKCSECSQSLNAA